ncbi:uncharacterized protein LOC132733353 [Ruditapes philippinarum]|uniref:uncharacterized protein LOC132733353 n=1 Tax=Ruditapes philippinarum TaxID=129788 RepID=UPI00295C0923|nr:uncharacterized protein LOC132733353 [Ruditapes philippinarum]
MTQAHRVSIRDLSEDDIQRAFEKTLQEFNPIPGIKLVRITEEYYEKALNLCRDHFVPHEPLMKSLGVKWGDFIEAYWLKALKLNLSLMFVDEGTDEPIAFRTIMHIFKDDKFQFDAEQLSDELKILIDFALYCDKQADFFDHYGVTEAYRFLSLVVTQKYQRRGFASKIFHAAINLVRNFGFDEVNIKGEGTSNFSKKIYEKEGYDVLYEHMFDEWEVDGRKPFLNTGEHKSMKIYGKKITQ